MQFKDYKKYLLFVIFAFLGCGYIAAQPGAFGGSDMSFTLIDKDVNKVIDDKSRDFKILN